jgi:CSLREA domain-containing protein
MASTNRFPRSLHKHSRRRPIQPMVEGLELRLVLSSSVGAAALKALSVALAKDVTGPSGQLIPLITPGPSGGTPQQLQDAATAINQIGAGRGIQGNASGQNAFNTAPGAILKEVMGPNGDLIPDQTSGPTGYTPQQLQAAYGLNQISFSGIKGDGTGQTIALVDAYDNPSFVNSSDPNFDTSALHVFDQQFGLPDPPTFAKVNQTGQSSPLAPAAGFSIWGVEIALDIEWAHAMAPGASIILVEAQNDHLGAGLENLIAAAATAATLAPVVSMSWSFTEFSAETNNDSIFAVPGVTFLASTGDHGAPGSYPALSPNVVAVGGTTLQNLDSNGDYPGTGTNGEVGWSGGGGVSQFEPESSYQQSVQNTGFRTIPDISADADPNTGVPVYDPYNFGTTTPWGDLGGTSLSSPLMAGMVAIADQGRVQKGGETFGSNALLTALYGLEISKPNDFHDVLSGNNGNAAGPGYDLVTGIGSPNGSQLVPDLGATVPTSPLVAIAIAPVDPVTGAGRTEQFTATGTYSDGTTQDITKLVTWASATPSVATIDANGLATTLSAGTSVITASSGAVTNRGDTLTVVAPAFVVNTTADDLDYADGKTSLREAALYANAFPGHIVTFDPSVFATNQTITLTLGQLELSDTTGTETITGPAAGVTVNVGGTSRVFQVDPSVTASISGMTATGGNAAIGGGLYNEGTTTLADCTVSGNSASYGGGGVSNYGSLALTNCTVSGNSTSRSGGGVSTGSSYYRGAITTLTNCTVSGNSSASIAGGVFNSFTGSALSLGNTIVAGNTAAFVPDSSGVFTSQGNNLIGKTDGSSGWVGSDLTGTIGRPLDPVLAPLGNYGGPTLTMALLPGSPAINAGASGPNIPAIDQPGLGRVGAVDIGAFESQGFSFTVVPDTTPQTSKIGTAFANPLAVSLTANNPIEPVNGGVVSFVADRSATGATAIFMAPSAVIANGQAAVIAAPNNVDGSYTVVASATGSSPASVSFALTNTGPVFAGLVVNTTSDSFAPGAGLLSLREAIAFANTAASGNSSISFDKKAFKLAQTITLTGTQLELSNTTGVETITGPKNGVTVSGGGLSRVFQVDRGVTASISGLTMTGGNSGNGGALYNIGATILTNCTVSGNSASRFGGGLYNVGTSTLTNCTVSGNSAGSVGGGLATASGSTSTLTNCTISGNAASGGGGVDVYGGAATLTNCTVSGNSASLGGGVYVGSYYYRGATTTLTNCTISGNTAIFGGGLYNYDTATMTSCTVNGNSAQRGAGITNGGSLALTSCTVSGNSAVGTGIFTGIGAGITNSGSLALTNCTVSDNSASNKIFGGGGVTNHGTATLTNCTLSGNSSAYGGGLYNAYNGAATLANCTISGNSVSGGGGGVFNFSRAAVTLTNCTISGNVADGTGTYDGANGGGGVYNGVSSTANLINCTIGGNSANGAGGGGGVKNNAGGTATLTNCTVSGNSANGAGGGVLNNATLNVFSSKINKNQATSRGGGISTTAGTATIIDSVINDNQVNSSGTALGGGIDCENSLLSLTNDTINTNQANGTTALGGGIYALDSTVDALDCTVKNNQANGTVLGEGGGMFGSGSVVSLTSTKVKGNKASTSGDDIFLEP